MAASSPSQWLWPSSSEMLPHSYQSLMMMPYSDDTSTNNQLFFNTTNSYYYDWSDITETQNDTLVPPNKLEDFMGTHSTSSTSPSLVGYTPNNSLQNTSNQSYLTGSDFIASNNKELLMFNHTHTSPVQALPLRMTQVAQGGKKMITSSTTTADNTATFGHRTSVYRGVTRHRWTGRYEAHLWDNTYRREGQTRKGRQVYLGGYDKEQKAARAYDLAALKYWGPTATTNFAISNYTKELEEMENMTKQEFIASLRRKSSGFSRGASVYRGVTRHHQQGRWQARIGRVSGNKDLYLGTFGTEEEAAEAYDIAAIKFRGLNAVTNFEMSRYNVETIANSSLPIGGGGPKRLKLSLEVEPAAARLLLDHDQKQPESASSTSTIVAVSPGVDGYVDVSYQNPGSTSGSSSDSTCSTAIAGPVMVVPPLEFCSRNLYGFANPAVNFNNNPTANINCQPWSLTSSSH